MFVQLIHESSTLLKEMISKVFVIKKVPVKILNGRGAGHPPVGCLLYMMGLLCLTQL
jgi:hypothetical protein